MTPDGMNLLLPVAEVTFNGKAPLQQAIRELHENSSKAEVEANGNVPALMRRQLADCMVIKGNKSMVPPPMACRTLHYDDGALEERAA